MQTEAAAVPNPQEMGEESARAQAYWECSRCKLRNEEEATSCQVCLFRRPRKSRMSRSTNAQSASSSSNREDELHSLVDIIEKPIPSELYLQGSSSLSVALNDTYYADRFLIGGRPTYKTRNNRPRIYWDATQSRWVITLSGEQGGATYCFNKDDVLHPGEITGKWIVPAANLKRVGEDRGFKFKVIGSRMLEPSRKKKKNAPNNARRKRKKGGSGGGMRVGGGSKTHSPGTPKRKPTSGASNIEEDVALMPRENEAVPTGGSRIRSSSGNRGSFSDYDDDGEDDKDALQAKRRRSGADNDGPLLDGHGKGGGSCYPPDERRGGRGDEGKKETDSSRNGGDDGGNRGGSITTLESSFRLLSSDDFFAKASQILGLSGTDDDEEVGRGKEAEEGKREEQPAPETRVSSVITTETNDSKEIGVSTNSLPDHSAAAQSGDNLNNNGNDDDSDATKCSDAPDDKSASPSRGREPEQKTPRKRRRRVRCPLKTTASPSSSSSKGTPLREREGGERAKVPEHAGRGGEAVPDLWEAEKRKCRRLRELEGWWQITYANRFLAYYGIHANGKVELVSKGERGCHRWGAEAQIAPVMTAGMTMRKTPSGKLVSTTTAMAASSPFNDSHGGRESAGRRTTKACDMFEVFPVDKTIDSSEQVRAVRASDGKIRKLVLLHRAGSYKVEGSGVRLKDLGSGPPVKVRPVPPPLHLEESQSQGEVPSRPLGLAAAAGGGGGRAPKMPTTRGEGGRGERDGKPSLLSPRVFVKGIPRDFPPGKIKEELTRYFQDFGEVWDIVLPMQKNRALLYALVYFRSRDIVWKIVDAHHGSIELLGATCIIRDGTQFNQRMAKIQQQKQQYHRPFHRHGEHQENQHHPHDRLPQHRLASQPSIEDETRECQVIVVKHKPDTSTQRFPVKGMIFLQGMEIFTRDTTKMRDAFQKIGAKRVYIQWVFADEEENDFTGKAWIRVEPEDIAVKAHATMQGAVLHGGYISIDIRPLIGTTCSALFQPEQKWYPAVILDARRSECMAAIEYKVQFQGFEGDYYCVRGEEVKDIAIDHARLSAYSFGRDGEFASRASGTRERPLNVSFSPARRSHHRRRSYADSTGLSNGVCRDPSLGKGRDGESRGRSSFSDEPDIGEILPKYGEKTYDVEEKGGARGREEGDVILLCPDFRRLGKCRNGDRCEYSHDVQI